MGWFQSQAFAEEHTETSETKLLKFDEQILPP
jgi:hypothetical protein